MNWKQIGEYKATCCKKAILGHLYSEDASSRVFPSTLKLGNCTACELPIIGNLTNVQGIITKPEYEVVEDVE